MCLLDVQTSTLTATLLADQPTISTTTSLRASSCDSTYRETVVIKLGSARVIPIRFQVSRPRVPNDTA